MSWHCGEGRQIFDVAAAIPLTGLTTYQAITEELLFVSPTAHTVP